MKNSRGTEIKIDDFTHLGVVFGSIDKNNPKTIYIKISAWGNPIDFDEGMDYSAIIRRIDKKVRTVLYNNLDDKLINKETYMVDMDMRQSGIIADKSSFMSCEITLQQFNNYLITSEVINTELTRLTSAIIEDVFLHNEHFKFYENKKDAKKKLKESLIE